MSSHDLVRVFKGVGLVVDHLIIMNKSGLKEKISRAQFHASELMKIAFEIRGDVSNGSDNKANESGNSQNSNYNVHDDFSDHVSSTMTSSTSPAPTYVAPSAPAAPPVTPYTAPVIHPVHQSPLPLNTTFATSAAMPAVRVQGTVATSPANAASMTTDDHISIPISIKDFSATNSQHTEVPKLVCNADKPEDLIGFEPVAKATSQGSHSKQGGARDGNTVINGVKTSSMRERAVPATQLVSSQLMHDLRNMNAYI